MMLSQSLDTEAMSYALQLKEFGKWAREGDNLKKLSSLSSPMFKEYKSGWPESREYIADIGDEYALFLDKHMTRLPQRNRDIVILHYVYLQSLRGIAKILRTNKDSVRDHLSHAITFLYSGIQATL